MKKTYKIEVDCANCANKMEVATKTVAGERRAYRDRSRHNCKKVEDDCEIEL